MTGILLALKVNTWNEGRLRQNLEKEVASGLYKTASEIIREGLRMLEVKREREEVLKEAIEVGRKSGYIENFEMDAFLLELEKKYG